MKDKIVTTDAWQMGLIGFQKWTTNLLKFAAPLGVLYFGFVIGNINLDGFQTSDFVPSQLVIGGLLLYILNAVQDFLRKLTTEQKYIVEKTKG